MLPVTMHSDEQLFLRKVVAEIKPGSCMVEWGSGGSTVMFADSLRDDVTLFSVEHNPDWFDKVGNALLDHPRLPQVVRFFVPPTYPLEFYGYGGPNEECPAGLTDYVNPDPLAAEWGRAEVILVDGIARGAILQSLWKRARGTRIFLHDHVPGREPWYGWALDGYEVVRRVNTLLELRRTDEPGPGESARPSTAGSEYPLPSG